jgi:hypothetical protein
MTDRPEHKPIRGVLPPGTDEFAFLGKTWGELEQSLGGRFRNGLECPEDVPIYQLADKRGTYFYGRFKINGDADIETLTEVLDPYEGEPLDEDEKLLLAHLEVCPVCRYAYQLALKTTLYDLLEGTYKPPVTETEDESHSGGFLADGLETAMHYLSPVPPPVVVEQEWAVPLNGVGRAEVDRPGAMPRLCFDLKVEGRDCLWTTPECPPSLAAQTVEIQLWEAPAEKQWTLSCSGLINLTSGQGRLRVRWLHRGQAMTDAEAVNRFLSKVLFQIEPYRSPASGDEFLVEFTGPAGSPPWSEGTAGQPATLRLLCKVP